MKKVNVFKTTFPTGETHYGISEQAHTSDTYLKKCISIAIGNINSGRGWSVFHESISKYKLESVVELIQTFDDSTSARELRNSLIKNDTNSINQLSAGTLSKLNYQLNEVILPIEKSKSMTSKDGSKIYFVELGYARLKGLLERVNLNSKHPILSNFVMVKEGSYKIVRA